VDQEKNDSFDDIVHRFVASRKKESAENEYWKSLDKVVEALYILAERIFDICFHGGNQILVKESSIEVMVNRAYDKIGDFDPAKGRAFNYFTIVMLKILRKQYRSYKNYGVKNA
jgi:hypothetical protein